MIWVTAWAWTSKMTIIGSQSEQAQCERIHLCSELKMKNHFHQECYARDRKNFLRSMIRNHERWVYSSAILTCWAVMTDLRSSSSSYYLDFEKAKPRSWNAAKYTREFECSWKRFWSSTCSTRSWWITQWFKKFGNTVGNRWWCWGFWETKELRIVGAKNHCHQYFYLAFQ